MFRNGFELYTGITNVLIFITSIILIFKTKEKKWKIFFILMAIDSFLGTIIHTFNINNQIVNILWYILAFSFSITINNLLMIFINKEYKFKNVLFISILFYILLFIERLLNIEFLYTFIIYAILVMFFIFIKSIYKKYKFCIFAFLFQFIGGILLIARIKILCFDYNSLYHLFMIPTLLLFYIHTKN